MALFDDGNPTRLTPIELKILSVLIEKPNAVVSKADLMSRVWGKCIVGDNALHVHVAGLRKVLGDDIISTKRGVGYRFTAPVSQPEETNGIVGNLPIIGGRGMGHSPLIGRDEDLKNAVQLLRTARLVSLTGPGGVGKTSLGLQTARQCAALFTDGVWLVELSALREPKIAASQIAATLGLGLGKTDNPLRSLGRLLHDKNILLVLDNCEHLADACGRICETLLSAAPRLKILATTRHALSCAGEMVFAVPALALPGETWTTPASIRKSAAFELFLERARGAASGFAIHDSEVGIAAQICRRVDGLPLAIEMVASWAALFGLQTLDEKLQHSISSWPRARNTAPPRQLTLTATLEWSHGLLSVPEQMVLRRLSVFANPFTMQAVEAVVSDEYVRKESLFEHLAALIRKSMVAVIPGTRPPAFRLLETTRALMQEKLAEAPEASSIPRRHAGHVLETLGRANDEFQTVPDTIWLRRYAPILPDLREALDWATANDSELAIALAGAGWVVWHEMSLPAEGRQRLNAIVKLVRPQTPPELSVRVQRALAELSLNTDSVGFAHNSLLEVAALYRELDACPELGSALSKLAFSAVIQGRTEEARAYIMEAIDLLQKDRRPRDLARAHNILMVIEFTCGHYAEATETGNKTIRLCEALGDGRTASVVSSNLVEAAIMVGDLAGALTKGKDLAARLRTTPFTEIFGYVLGLVGCTLLFQEKPDEAVPVLREAATILKEEGMMFWLFDKFALSLALNGRHSDAAVVAGFAFGILEKSGRTCEPLSMRVRETLYGVLREKLSDDVLGQLVDSGKYLTEDRALSLALEY